MTGNTSAQRRRGTIRASAANQARSAGSYLPPGGHPLHGLLAWERAAVVELFEAWGEIDRSHRKLAHRRSRTGLVHVSESTVARVLAAEGLALPGNPPREPAPRTPWPDWLEWKPNRVWACDFTHWSRARRASIAILDVVSRKWLATLTSAEESSTQVEACFLAALDAEDLLQAADQRATEALRAAITSGEKDTVHGLAAGGRSRCCWPSATTGRRCARTPPASSRPGWRSPSSPAARTLPRTRRGSRLSSATSRASGRTWRRSPTPANSTPSWTGYAPDTTGCACTPRSDLSPPTTNTKAEVMPYASNAATGSRPHATPASNTVEAHPRRASDHEPPVAGYFTA